jgi:uncharacterized protein (DUF2267 family)
MPTARVDIIDRSVEQAHIWINDLAEELATEDPHQAYRVLRTFLQTLRDHLSVDEGAQLSAQLPIFIRGIFYESWDPGHVVEHSRDVDSFLVRITTEAGLAGETEASFAVAAAGRVLQRHISPGEATSVLHALPRRLRQLLDD